MSASGTATSFISSGLNRPIALAFDGSGNLYVANYSGNSISKVTVDGTLTSFINSGLSSPAGLAFDGSGNLYVSNYSNNSISKISASGIVSSYINYDLNRPRGLRYDTLNNVLYVANYNGSSVSKILAPVAYSPVTCNNGTITLMASPQTPSSEAIDWYALATGGSALFTGSNNFTTPIITTTTNYYAVARNTTTGCVSATRTAITATINSCNTWVGGNSIDWSNPVNWSAGTVPGDTSDVTIPSGTTNAPNANTTQTVRNLVIDSGAVVTVTGTLQIAGSITNNGTFNANAGTVVLNGTSAQTIPANAFTSSIVNNLTINNISGVTLGGALKITGVLTPTAGVLNTGGNLTLVSTTVSGGGAIGQGSSAGGYINGTVNVQRFSQAQRGYRTLSHPYTTDQSLSLLTDNIRITGLTAANGLYGVAGGAAQAFNYVPTGLAGNASQVLVPITNATSNSWAVGKAIYLFVRGNGNEGAGGPGSSSYSGTISPVTLDVSSGNVNQGDVIVNLAYGSALTDNYNLIGNPYPCPINLKNVTGITSYGTVYVYNPVKSSGILDAFTLRGGFDSYDNAGNPDIIIPSMGGFYIKATGAGQSLTFHETDKAINSTPTYSVFGTTKIPSFRLNISTSKGNVDDVKIGFNSTSTAAANDTYDAPKLVNGLFDFYSLSSNNKQLAIDYRSESQVTNSIIPLGIKTNVYGTYSISLSAFKDLPTTQLLLRDKLLNKEIPLTKVGDSYTFDITSDTLTKGNNRFEIGLLTATVLPTKLTSFTAQLQTNNNVAVTWVAASEVNVDYYQVQRSTNGNSFSSIGKVDAKGADNYTYNDDLSTVTPQPSTVYYRLQMADKDGSVAYSKVVHVQLATARKALSIYPNPVQATLFAQVTATKAGKITIVVTDMQGKQLRSQTAALNEGITALSLDLNGLAAGNYVLVVTDSDGEQQKQQFVKQ